MQLTAGQSNSLHGEVAVPGDKSITHRAVIWAAMAKGVSRIQHPLISGVTLTMLAAVQQLGVKWTLDGDVLTIDSPGAEGFTVPQKPLDCKNSATTMRLLAGCLSAAGVAAVLDGSEGLRRRPMQRIIEPLRSMGVQIEAADGGKAPLILPGRASGEKIKGVGYRSPVASAQVKSCVLLAALAADRPVEYREPTLSRNHTELMFSHQAIQVDTETESDGVKITMRPGEMAKLYPLNIKIPGDFSAASFLITAALITQDSSIILRNVGLNPTRTGLMKSLQEMGACIQVLNPREEAGEEVGDLQVCSSALTGGRVSGQRVVDMIDEFPIYAVAAAYVAGTTQVSEAAELRLKESDRIEMLCGELKRQGILIEERNDGFSICGRGWVQGGAEAEPHRDHRLAMSLAVLGLNSREPVTVNDAEILSESYPEFPRVLLTLGANIHISTGGADEE